MIRTSSQTGSLHAFESADLYAKISGYLKILNVDIGDQVKEGQLLAAIDVPEILKQAEHDKAAVEQAKAMVKQAMAKIETAQAELKASQAVVRKDQAEVERFAASRRFHEKEVTRYKELVHKQAEAQEKLDKELELFEEALAAEHSGQAKVVSSQANVLSAQALVEQYKADLAEAQANVQVGVSNEAKTEVLVDYTRIISPYSGVITYRGFHRGAFIRAAQGGEIHPILTVARTDKFRVVTYIPDRDVPFADVGDRALVTLDALPGEVFEGKVSRFEEAEDPKSRTMRTEIDLPNPEGRLREGMYGIATIILNEATESLTVPTCCLTGKSEGGKATVCVLEDGTVKSVPVKIGGDDGLKVEVLSGLKPDANVILSPGLVAPGSPAIPILTETANSPVH